MGVDKTDSILTTRVEGKKNLDKAFEDYHKLIEKETLISKLKRYKHLYDITMLKLEQLLEKETRLIHEKHEDNTKGGST